MVGSQPTLPCLALRQLVVTCGAGGPFSGLRGVPGDECLVVYAALLPLMAAGWPPDVAVVSRAVLNTPARVSWCTRGTGLAGLVACLSLSARGHTAFQTGGTGATTPTSRGPELCWSHAFKIVVTLVGVSSLALWF